MRSILGCKRPHAFGHGTNVIRDRREFIAKTAAAALVPGVCSGANVLDTEKKKLELFALHTQEYLRTYYRVDGELLQPHCAAIDHLLRDHRTNEVHVIDPHLFDYLHDLGQLLGLQGPFEVISGYRSAATNAQLRRSSSGVAKRSFHMFGRAVDIRVPDIAVSEVRDAAISLERGGVGYYPRSEFIHLDTGRFRHW